jgi:hypothetical protein
MFIFIVVCADAGAAGSNATVPATAMASAQSGRRMFMQYLLVA